MQGVRFSIGFRIYSIIGLSFCGLIGLAAMQAGNLADSLKQQRKDELSHLTQIALAIAREIQEATQASVASIIGIGEVIRNGRPDKGMPAFSTLKDSQIADIVAFLHHQADEALHSANVPGDYPLAKMLTGANGLNGSGNGSGGGPDGK